MGAAPMMFATLAALPAAPAYPAWRPFLTAMPIWDYWVWLALPLCVGVALVYKTTKCRFPGTILRESVWLSLWIVLGLIGAAIAVSLAVRLG
jgi:hypothetical protein